MVTDTAFPMEPGKQCKRRIMYIISQRYCIISPFKISEALKAGTAL